MKEFILQKFKEEKCLQSGAITAMIVYQMKPDNIRGLFWKVEKLLDDMVTDRILYQKGEAYYISEVNHG